MLIILGKGCLVFAPPSIAIPSIGFVFLTVTLRFPSSSMTTLAGSLGTSAADNLCIDWCLLISPLSIIPWSLFMSKLLDSLFANSCKIKTKMWHEKNSGVTQVEEMWWFDDLNLFWCSFNILLCLFHFMIDFNFLSIERHLLSIIGIIRHLLYKHPICKFIHCSLTIWFQRVAVFFKCKKLATETHKKNGERVHRRVLSSNVVIRELK